MKRLSAPHSDFTIERAGRSSALSALGTLIVYLVSALAVTALLWLTRP